MLKDTYSLCLLPGGTDKENLLKVVEIFTLLTSISCGPGRIEGIFIKSVSVFDFHNPKSSCFNRWCMFYRYVGWKQKCDFGQGKSFKFESERSIKAGLLTACASWPKLWDGMALECFRINIELTEHCGYQFFCKSTGFKYVDQRPTIHKWKKKQQHF